MNDTKYNELVEKLTNMLSVGGIEPPVSPTLRSGEDRLFSPDSFYVEKNLEIDKLNKNELLLTHVLLHKFYASGLSDLSKQEIKRLHTEVSKKISHSNFDKLDE